MISGDRGQVSLHALNQLFVVSSKMMTMSLFSVSGTFWPAGNQKTSPRWIDSRLSRFKPINRYQGTAPWKLAMQTDGNLVIYGANGFVWNTGKTRANVAPFTLIMQDDGNLVVYDKNHGFLWGSKN
jgi:hypothetical protein